MFKKIHTRRTFLVVIFIFALFFPPLVLLSFYPFQVNQAKTLLMHRKHFDSIMATSATHDQAVASHIRSNVAVAISQEELTARETFKAAQVQAIIILSIGGLSLALSTTYLLMRQLVAPLLSLGEQIRELGIDPDHNSRIRVDGSGEFEDIASVLNRHMELLQQKDRQLFHAQQMEMTGLLAGGLSHEFNTVLTSITGFTEILKKKLLQGDPLHQYLDHILKATTRGSHLTRSLRPFQRQGLILPDPIDVNLLTQELEESVGKIIGDNIQVCCRPSTERLLVMGDRYYLFQVLLNMVNNARDAMPGGGALYINVDTVEIDDAFVLRQGYGSPGQYVTISVIDNGIGMEREVMNRVFQPFFTTKEIGKGTGLGLTIAFGIVREHKGFVAVHSEPGQGAAFSIHLPLYDEVSQ